MRKLSLVVAIAVSIFSTGCITKSDNPVDPFESINRETHKFNMAFDATFLKPPAKLYRVAVIAPVRVGIDNAYNNINMIPTVANDILQWDWNQAVKDFWRFFLNSTLGLAGFTDPATKLGLPPHSNDLGLTFAKWGDKKSPYIVLPFFGPSTIRDSVGMALNYAFLTPYPYVQPPWVLYTILGVRYVDLRSQMLENESLIAESLDQYSFIRDAYLQRREFLITGKVQDDIGQNYVEEFEEEDKDDEPAAGSTPSEFPLTTN